MGELSFFLTNFHLQERYPSLDPIMYAGAEYIIFLSLVIALILAIKAGSAEKKALLYILISIPIAILLIKLTHILIYTDRPFVTYGFVPLIPSDINASFPSRHVSALSAIVFSYFYSKSKFAAVQLVLLFWVGIARVYAGVHYPIDIIGGILTGLVALLLSIKFLKFIH